MMSDPMPAINACYVLTCEQFKYHNIGLLNNGSIDTGMKIMVGWSNALDSILITNDMYWCFISIGKWQSDYNNHPNHQFVVSLDYYHIVLRYHIFININ